MIFDYRFEMHIGLLYDTIGSILFRDRYAWLVSHALSFEILRHVRTIKIMYDWRISMSYPGPTCETFLRPGYQRPGRSHQEKQSILDLFMLVIDSG